MSEIQSVFWDVISYDQAMTTMMDLHAKRVKDEIPDTFALLQHKPVITRGRRMQGQEIPGQDLILEKGIEISDADRGGQLTFHGPGQLVIYFVFRLESWFPGVNAMVHGIENILIEFLNERFGLETRADKDHPGIWLGQQKLASIGLRVSEGVTRHGIAFNIANDLDVYNLFDPCGLSGQVMTNLSQVLQKKFNETEVWQIGKDLQKYYIQKFQERG